MGFLGNISIFLVLLCKLNVHFTLISVLNRSCVLLYKLTCKMRTILKINYKVASQSIGRGRGTSVLRFHIIYIRTGGLE